MATTFNEHELLERVDNDVGFLAETVEMIAADGPGLMEQLRAALTAGDAAGVTRHAHAIKGMISNFCAPEAQAAALAVEKLGKAGDAAGAAGPAEELGAKLAALTAELQALVRAKAS